MKTSSTALFAIALTGSVLATISSTHASVVLNWIDWTAPSSYDDSANGPAGAYTYTTSVIGNITKIDNSVVD